MHFVGVEDCGCWIVGSLFGCLWWLEVGGDLSNCGEV